jgi:hypothetical protein
MARMEDKDWTEQVGRVVGLWLSRGLVRTEKAVGEIVRVTPKMFVVRIKDEDREVKFVRTRVWASSDGMRYEWGHGSKKNPSRVYRDPLPED